METVKKPIREVSNDINTLKEAFEWLQKNKTRNDSFIYTLSFNGKTLTSEMTLDEIYLEVTGLTQSDYKQKVILDIEKMEKEAELERKDNFQKVKDSVVLLNEMEKDCGNLLLTKLNELMQSKNKSIFNYAEYVEVVELYKIYKKYETNEKVAFNKTTERIISQNHSGTSLQLVCALLKMSKLGEGIVNHYLSTTQK